MAEVEIWKKFGSIEVSNMGNLKTRNHKDGSWIGSKTTKGYRDVWVNDKMIRVNRLVAHLFLDVALDDIRNTDHINGNRSDNRVENLRMVTGRENSQNRVEHRSGRLVGASKFRDKWTSWIQLNGKNIYLGLFPTELEAHQCYMKVVEAFIV